MAQSSGGSADSSNCVPQVTQIGFTFKDYLVNLVICFPKRSLDIPDLLHKLLYAWWRRRFRPAVPPAVFYASRRDRAHEFLESPGKSRPPPSPNLLACPNQPAEFARNYTTGNW
jgi:hypothetical protein